MDYEDGEYVTDKNCPKCGSLADYRLPAAAWNHCKHCRIYFDDDGNDMSEFCNELTNNIQAAHDAFLEKLLFHAQKHLADEPTEHPVKQLLASMELPDNCHSLSKLFIGNISQRTREYQHTQRPNLEAEEVIDPITFLSRLSQVFVIDFIAECQRFLDSLSSVDRQMVMDDSFWRNSRSFLQVMELLEGFRASRPRK